MMRAGHHRFRPTWSSLLHLLRGGTRLVRAEGIVILRVVLLLDVSRWQGAINFVTMQAAGVRGIIIKCGQGLAADPRFVENWQKARTAKVPRGSYWFYDSRVDPKSQAALWWNKISADKGELMHFADYEESYGGAWGGWQNLKIFLQEFQRLSGFPSERIGVYTGYYYWIAHSPTATADLNWFGQFPLWLAWYTDNPANVIIPKPWITLVLWQYGTPVHGLRYGVESLEVDENNFNGDESMYRARFGLELPAPLPDTGGNAMAKLYKGTVTVAAGVTLQIRSGPGTSYPDIGDLFRGDKLEASEILGGWWKLTKVIRDGALLGLQSGDNYSSDGHGMYIRTDEVIDYTPTDPPPAGEIVTPDYIIVHYDDGTEKKFVPE